MEKAMTTDDVIIRTTLKPGDIGYITYLHGSLYKEEYNYGITFETYVATGLLEFYNQYDAHKDRVWICEFENKIVGFLLLLHRSDTTAQLRYFILLPKFRGLGLGKKMMQLFMDFLSKAGYEKCYLWTTHEQETAAALYKRFGFRLTEEKESSAFGKPLKEQRYDMVF